ncbi:ATP-binding protein [Pseudomonas sp. MH10]|uniref:ATP-binding protein n=1 Tax=Pseudomonas sp. MH10 TaxID=3048627 RepID=UPI002AC97C69|nr:ATP-binding protein [Pseudomonas sp. MH10]MEB0042649.1 ATP-binding protein [Pseudomonas sp. MH10]WPX63527.1 ATP-binding protein [Pseudomonas sp. MH10]
MYIKAIKIDIQTDNGPFGFSTEFSRNLNIIRGRNSAGKSTIVHAIMYAMGMEELLGAQNENALTYALKDYLEHEELKYRILTSKVTIEIESNGKTITATRSIKEEGLSTKLIKIQECSALTKAETAPILYKFLHDGLSAQIDEGFFTYFERFLGLQLPLVPRTNGKPVKLYLQYVFAAMIIEQKRGWTDYIANLPYFGVRDARIKIVDFLVGTDVFETDAKRDSLDQESKSIYDEWQILYRTLVTEVLKHGFKFSNISKTPASDFNAGLVDFHRTSEGVTESILEYRKRKINDHVLIGLRLAQQGETPTLEITQSIEKYTSELERFTVAYETSLGNLALYRVDLNSNRINTQQAKDELTKNQAAQKLIKFGASLRLSTASNSCPACHQAIGHSLVDLHESTPHMDIGTNIAYLTAQLRMLERERGGIDQSIQEAEALKDQLAKSIAVTKSALRALRSDLNSNSSVSKSGIRVQVQIEMELEDLTKFEGYSDETLDALALLAKRLAKNQRNRTLIPSIHYSPTDLAKYTLFEKMFRANISAFDYHSAAIADIEFNRDNLLPYLAKIELREINERSVSASDSARSIASPAPSTTPAIAVSTSVTARSDESPKGKGNIARESSASDFVRLIWSYLLSIYQTSSHPTVNGNHLGLLLLDEPGQHSMATKSQQALFQLLSSEEGLQSIVAASFEDNEATYKEATANVVFKLIRLGDKSIAPVIAAVDI